MGLALIYYTIALIEKSRIEDTIGPMVASQCAHSNWPPEVALIIQKSKKYDEVTGEV